MKKIRLNCTATLDETFADFLLSRRAKGLAEKTLESYSSQWKAVARHLDTGTDIAALQKADLDAMIVSMRDAGLSPNSINSYTRVLKSFFSWCNEQGLTRLNIPLYKAEETVKETYSDAELTALLKKPDIRKTTFAEYRDWVIINFLLNCGSRAAGVTVAGSLRIISFARRRVHNSRRTACGNLSQGTTRGAECKKHLSICSATHLRGNI